MRGMARNRHFSRGILERLADLVHDFGERNRRLLEVRDALQLRIDAHHRDRVGQPLDLADYEGFLREVGYLLPQIDDFNIRTANVDDEIAHIAGPQVPLSNARYALNAANARWAAFTMRFMALTPFPRPPRPRGVAIKVFDLFLYVFKHSLTGGARKPRRTRHSGLSWPPFRSSGHSNDQPAVATSSRRRRKLGYQRFSKRA